MRLRNTNHVEIHSMIGQISRNIYIAGGTRKYSAELLEFEILETPRKVDAVIFKCKSAYARCDPNCEPPLASGGE